MHQQQLQLLNVADGEQLLLIGKGIGRTALFIWDGEGKRTVMVYVFELNQDVIKARIQRLLDAADIHEVTLEANKQEGKVVMSGDIPEYKEDLFELVVDEFYDDVIDLVSEETIEDLIQIDMQITELNTTLSKSLGIEWTTGGRSGISPNYVETPWPTDGHIRDFFKIGEFNRSGELIAAVNALITEGKARVLSKPKLVVVSGEEASFLVGGEVPIRTTTFSETGSSQENVEFKEFGINLTITPTIKKEKIDIIMNLEVSEIDASTASSISEDVAFSTRSASTHLYLEDAQPIVLAGMIRHAESKTLSKIPFVGDIPILGLLFRNKTNPVPTTDQELVIALTPRILNQRSSSKNLLKNKAETKSRQKGTRFEKVPHYMGIPREMTSYVRRVQEKILQSVEYPSVARKRGWEGTVKVGMLILDDGTLAFALVKESSGHDIFDKLAVDAARDLAPFGAFPDGIDLKELSITLPIVYSLGDN